ncbi:MAG: S-methyl-5'-thioadenosine phosphorylase [Zetaproteobacteria bacterium CG_4_9_14_3_um_filter_49_83]|nr:MAG: methylthioadenosine phosphorylase [Zetaproteobacteria bacterium CG1_02_49_23]PIQ34862.1 MAG: S-methyl-5'-thioadenosine phosphorylase [Zetaproteobacteria bacterium CG17_big_fil_post_rev_8_21_14_2_50_50_13]PIV31174.1 MAG: S-methyl-5'-thioadenosine phosphorylase [Zetaproteobacteria bacterium CG02_land_8_20_14_3_00_50_9]PIY55814.1 MAG: S-methyl-5'-thioadenosine phosphorylase [Zetaproteobacteria bacterium CG_4_10_14_0_8_um_filter_49_80]PJA36196.1 MAG: S-methyl-5'-thioadenosine phosphorylase 
MTSRIGIIGGSGLYDLEGLEILDYMNIDTPWGKPSDKLMLASHQGQEIVFLPRHGQHHSFPPHHVPYRANIYAMKLAGVKEIISISAVGSLREEIKPGDFVLPDQFIDRTRSRASTFFEGPLVAHVSMADPICSGLQNELHAACCEQPITTHLGGTYLVMEGPQFSTRAESNLYRQWGMDIIGMTNMPEAKLAREAEICYATVAMCTDFDCWHEEEDNVSVSSVVEVMRGNVMQAKAMLKSFLDHRVKSTAIQTTGDNPVCACQSALEHGLFADLKQCSDSSLRPIHALVERLL